MSAVRSLGVLLASAVLVAGLAPGASGQEVQADETSPGTTVLVPVWFDQQPAPPEPTPRAAFG